MGDSLDMSSASIISRSVTDSQHTTTNSEPGSSIPSLPSPPSPRSLVVEPSSSTTSIPQAATPLSVPPSTTQSFHSLPPTNGVNDLAESSIDPKNTSSSSSDVKDPLPIPPAQPPVPSSRSTYLWNTFKSFLAKITHIVFKDNNLPLILNIIYHAAAARSLIAEPWLLVNRYIKVPIIQQQQSQQAHRPVLAAANLATDALRAVGAMHAALGLLAALALKERHIRAERSALLILTLASLGQTWAHGRAYWTNSKYSLRALQEVGSLDSLVFVVSSIALVKTVRRTGRLL